MSLFVQSPGVMAYGNFWQSTPPNYPSTYLGTAITPGTSNSMGSVVSLGTVGFDVSVLLISLYNFATVSQNSSAIADVMVDPAGGTNWSVLISGLVCGYTAGNLATQWCKYEFPIFIKSGSAIGVRAQVAHTVAPPSCRIVSQFYGKAKEFESGLWSGSAVETIGINTSTSRGVTITPVNGTTIASANPSWNNFGSTTTYDAHAVQFKVQASGLAIQSLAYEVFEFGYGGVACAPQQWVMVNSNENRTEHTQNGLLYIDIPAGTQLQCRAVSSMATPEAKDVAAYLIR